MRSVLPKNLIFLTSYSHARSLLQVFPYSASPNYPYSRRHDDDSRNVKVSVWWDFENCHIPAGLNVCKIGQAITEAVRVKGIKGPIQITAFGDVQQLSRANQEALAYTGVHLTHIPNGGKNSADRYLLVDIMYWVSQNPPPAHLFLISGDKDFASALHRLRMNNYNILLAIPGKASDVLCSAATIMWQWSSLLKGEDLTGKHFNHPPDGPLGSWYGNYKVPLENPFSTVEQSTSSQTVEIYEPTSDSKVGVIPKAVVRQVRHILSSHPKGISIIDLRAELAKCDVCLDKNLYGYKRFSRFLSSMPNIQLQPLGDGNLCVRLIPSESPESSESIVPSTTHADGTQVIASSNERRDDDTKSFQQVPSQGKPVREHVDDKSSFPPSVERDTGQPPNVCVADAQISKIQLPSKDSKLSKTKTSSSKKRLRKLPDNDIVRSEDVSYKIPEEYISDNRSAGKNNGMVNDGSKNFEAEDKYEKPTRKESVKVCHSPYSSAIDDSVVDKRPGGSSETYSKKLTFFSWIRSWWPFSKSSGKCDDLTTHKNKTVICCEESKFSELDKTVNRSEEPKLSEPDQTVSHSKEPKSSELDQNVSHSEKPELFFSDSFWSDVESFVLSPKGSLLFSQSRSRKDMAHKLQKDGPVFLRSLTEKDILQLLDLLIAEKKWLEESPSQSFPFRLNQSVQRSSLMGQSHGANGLRSLFVSSTSQSSLQKSLEHNLEKQNQSTHTGVSTPATELKYTERSKNDVLLDCEKLVKQILREHPKGYNIGSFRKLFVDTYGYHLDIHKLGYTKLASLLHIMPGAKLESTYIFPAVCASDREVPILKTQVTNASRTVSNSDCELSDSDPKDDDTDSPWEELGPVSINNSNHSDLESKLSQKDKELYMSKHPDYEPIVSDDDDSSVSDGDSSCLTKSEKQGRPKYSVQDSSFWQALDSWHNSKEGENNGVKKLDNVESLGKTLDDILNSSTESNRGTLSKIPSGNLREKHRSQKYSFVADPVLPNN